MVMNVIYYIIVSSLSRCIELEMFASLETLCYFLYFYSKQWGAWTSIHNQCFWASTEMIMKHLLKPLFTVQEWEKEIYKCALCTDLLAWGVISIILSNITRICAYL